MALIITPDQSTPAQQTADQIRQTVSVLFRQMQGVYQQTYSVFWKDPINVAAALGTDASDLFKYAAILAGAINEAKPGTITNVSIPEGYSVQASADGSVTITTPQVSEVAKKTVQQSK